MTEGEGLHRKRRSFFRICSEIYRSVIFVA